MEIILPFKMPTLKTVYRRIYSARISLIVTGIVLVGITMVEPRTLWLAMAGFLAILISNIFWPSRKNRQKFRQMLEKRQKRTWPRNSMKSVTEALDNPAFILDRNSILRSANRASERIFGPTTLGNPLSFKFRTPQIAALVESVIETGARQSITYDEQVIAKRWFLVECTPIPKAKGKDGQAAEPVFFLLSFTDLTQIRQTEQMRSDFVANASHELRTPLASLRGYIETLQGPAKDDAKARDEFLNIMLDQAERMSRLIDDLLSLSRIEMKAHMLPREVLDLSEILKHVLDTVSQSAEQYGTNLECTGIDTPCSVVGDRDELIQVFHNLVENACKYGRKNGKVEISLIRSEGKKPANGGNFSEDDNNYVARVIVEDDGPGVAEEHIPRLTERFYRANGKSGTVAKGTGLGLAIVKHIINRHNGILAFDSRPEEGMKVTVSFRR